MRLAGAGPADQDEVALLCDEVAAGKIAHQALIDRRSVEGKLVHILGERQLGDGQLVSDRARLLFRDLGLEQIADKALRLVLAFDRGGQCLVIRALHAKQLELAHHVEDFGSLHAHALLS